MSSDNTVIKIENVSKSYQIYKKPQDRLKQSLWRNRKKFYDEFWALRNITLDVKKGETVGIIGQNGSGKSTLLQVICGTVTPNSGNVAVNGRISALLELGSGFNPEFTGRENVHMNATILGLSTEEIESRFDRIADFADIGAFIEQPVKTYSSGMYVRLAFAVAINVDPDIMIVDEALAVGDEAFSRKCFARLDEIKNNGATILFVSHSAASILELCDRAVLLEKGESLLTASPKLVISMYHKYLYAPEEKKESVMKTIREINDDPSLASKFDDEGSNGKNGQTQSRRRYSTLRAFYNPHMVSKSRVEYVSNGAIVENPRIMTPEGEEVNVLVRQNDYICSYNVHFNKEAFAVRWGCVFKTVKGIQLGGIISSTYGEGVEHIKQGTTLTIKLKFRCSFMPGTYFYNTGVVGALDGVEGFLHRILDAGMFEVQHETNILAFGGPIDFSLE